MKRNIKFLFNNSEIGAGTRGASLGPEAVKVVARNQKDSIFAIFENEELETHNYLLDSPTKFTHALNIDGMVKIYETLNSRVSSLLKEQKFPFIIAADHGSAGGTIAGIASAFPESQIGVVWIDAHGDLHTPYTTPSGNLHGMPLATALGEDNIQHSRNDVDQETIEKWEQLKSCGTNLAKIKAENLIFVGVRDTEKEEDAIISRNNIKNHLVEDVNQKGSDAILNEIFTQLQNCDKIYVSFDVDSMDPALTSHGTGTPVANGLAPRQASELLCGLVSNPKVCCIEFVEINPCLDEKTNKMAETAYSLIKDVMKIIS